MIRKNILILVGLLLVLVSLLNISAGTFAATGTALTVAGDISLTGDEDIIQFANQIGNKINLYSTTFGIGVQNSELVNFAPGGSDFRWRDAVLGNTKMELDVTSGDLNVTGEFKLYGIR